MRQSVFSQGIEVLLKKAAVDAEFRELLLERRAAAAEAIALELTPAEAGLLAAIPRPQLEMTIAQTEVPEASRRVFMGQVAAAMLAALGLGATGCSHFGKGNGSVERDNLEYPPSLGIRPHPAESFWGPSHGMNSDRPLASVRPIYFDYDSTVIQANQIANLDHALKEIRSRANAGRAVMIEGHADERGSIEYNFALGERRAEAVRDYLMKNGVGAERLGTISKGKDQPVDPKHTEEAWAKNRRVELMWMY